MSYFPFFSRKRILIYHRHSRHNHFISDTPRLTSALLFLILSGKDGKISLFICASSYEGRKLVKWQSECSCINKDFWTDMPDSRYKSSLGAITEDLFFCGTSWYLYVPTPRCSYFDVSRSDGFWPLQSSARVEIFVHSCPTPAILKPAQLPQEFEKSWPFPHLPCHACRTPHCVSENH